jgi:uncharacterized membrane protein YqhA
MISRMIGASRFLVLLAVVGSFLAAVALIGFATIAVVVAIVDMVVHPRFLAADAKHIAVDFIELMDGILLGTVFLIISLGLYELFIDPDVNLPDWLRIDSLDELKGKLVSVVVVLLAVSFLGDVVEWDGSVGILYLGAAIGAVMLGLGLVLGFPGLRRHGEHGPEG